MMKTGEMGKTEMKKKNSAQFKPGISGNPKGRPRGAKNIPRISAEIISIIRYLLVKRIDKVEALLDKMPPDKEMSVYLKMVSLILINESYENKKLVERELKLQKKEKRTPKRIVGQKEADFLRSLLKTKNVSNQTRKDAAHIRLGRDISTLSASSPLNRGEINHILSQIKEGNTHVVYEKRF